MSVIMYNGEDLKALVEQPGKYVILDFFAQWCGPCKMLSPILHQIADEREDVCVVKIDTDENMELAETFQISSIPNVIIFKDGKPHNRFVGFRSRADIEKML